MPHSYEKSTVEFDRTPCLVSRGLRFFFMHCTLQKKAWLYRRFDVTTAEGCFKVEYDGKGHGFECVLVKNEIADLKKTVYRFAPRFDFMIGSLPAKLEVLVWLWLQIKSIKLEVNGQEVYAE